MINGQIKCNGTSRLLKSYLPDTYDEFKTLMESGQLPVDVLFNPTGWSVLPTFLNKNTLLKDSTAAMFGLDETAVPDDVLYNLSGIEKFAEFSTAGSYVLSDLDDTDIIWAFGIGAGGGGGGGHGYYGGGAGGGAGYAVFLGPICATSLKSKNIVIGSGGSGGAPENSEDIDATGGKGGDGGTTSLFGCSAFGGKGGAGGNYRGESFNKGIGSSCGAGTEYSMDSGNVQKVIVSATGPSYLIPLLGLTIGCGGGAGYGMKSYDNYLQAATADLGAGGNGRSGATASRRDGYAGTYGSGGGGAGGGGTYNGKTGAPGYGGKGGDGYAVVFRRRRRSQT